MTSHSISIFRSGYLSRRCEGSALRMSRASRVSVCASAYNCEASVCSRTGDDFAGHRPARSTGGGCAYRSPLANSTDGGMRTTAAFMRLTCKDRLAAALSCTPSCAHLISAQKQKPKNKEPTFLAAFVQLSAPVLKQ